MHKIKLSALVQQVFDAVKKGCDTVEQIETEVQRAVGLVKAVLAAVAVAIDDDMQTGARDMVTMFIANEFRKE